MKGSTLTYHLEGPKDYFFLQNLQTGSGVNSACHLMGTGFLPWG